MRRGHILMSFAALVLALAVGAASAGANTSHAGWPQITGMLLMNKADQSRPLDGRPGQDPFGGTDPTYSCDGLHLDTACLLDGPLFAPLDLPCDEDVSINDWPQFLISRLCSSPHTSTVPEGTRHNELLGGHGNDVIHAGPDGDVLWGDFKPSGQPTSQVDNLYGGPGKDFIYASHGRNDIRTGGGNDIIHAHFGHGTIRCEGGHARVYVRHNSHYRVYGCRIVTHKTLGF